MSPLLNGVLAILTIAALVLTTGAVLKLFPSLGDRVMGNDMSGRMSALDGLRGLLALCVFAHHSLVN